MGIRNGGGGFAGKIDFPAYMRNFHDDYLLNNAQVIIPILLAGASPYNAAFAFDPDTTLDDVQTNIDNYETAIEAIDPSADAIGFWTDAAAEVDAEVLPDSYITDLATSFETANKPAYLRSVNAFTSGMSDINAVHNSSFIIGLALMESQFQNQIDAFTAGAEMQRDQNRVGAITSLAALMGTFYTTKLSSLNTISALQLEQGRFVMTAKQNQYDKDIELDVRDLLWDFDVLDRGGMLLGAINGAPSAPNPPGPIQQMGSMGLSTISSLIPLLGML